MGISKWERTLKALQNIIDRYNSNDPTEWDKIGHVRHCPLCDIHRVQIGFDSNCIVTCCGCPVVARAGWPGCMEFNKESWIGISGGKHLVNPDMVIRRKNYARQRARAYTHVLDVVKHTPAKYFTKTNWKYIDWSMQRWKYIGDQTKAD